MKKTKIICSIGPSSNTYSVFKSLADNGMNVARVNFSHATLEERKIVEELVTRINLEEDYNIGLLYDTKGPEFRSGEVVNGSINLKKGNSIKLVYDKIVGDETKISVNHPNVLKDLSIDDTVLLVNGLIKTKVTAIDNEGVTLTILNDGVLGNNKSMSVPGVKLNIPFISDTDREDIIYACKNKGDFLALSFVSCKEDILEVRNILKEYNREDIQIISKIESVTGIDNIEEILENSDGIMIARGDLGTEVDLSTLPIHQRMIINKCREYGKYCIVATEMLVSMKKSIRPTRAEVSDVSNAVFNGCDAVMLSDETTIGNYPVETVSYMTSICENAEKYYNYDKKFNVKWQSSITEAIAKSVIDASNSIDSKLIVATTMSGRTARKISNLKPKNIILATVPSKEVAKSLALNYGVYSKIVKVSDTTDEIIKDAISKAHEFVNLSKGDKVIITGGFPNNLVKNTNFMKIEEI